MNPFLGVVFHAIGGLAAGSFYIPFRKVRGWSWETFWLVNGVFSWILAPWVASLLTVPNPIAVLSATPWSVITKSYVLGALWGIGGLTFGLSMRYLGLSLGYALALGSCAAFGTLIPPLMEGKMDELLATTSGKVVMGGVLLCLVGIAICGKAGINKEREMPAEAKRETIREFDFKKGVFVAIFCGILSACMAFAIAAAKPMGELAVEQGTKPLYQNNPAYIIIMLGGFTTNLLWCGYLHWKNRSAGQYAAAAEGGSLPVNYIFCALAGITWFLQFFFYGMGTTQLGEQFDFSSWTLHMAFIIVFSNIWALGFREWRGASSRTRGIILTGILVLIVSTVVIGWGNYLAEG